SKTSTAITYSLIRSPLPSSVVSTTYLRKRFIRGELTKEALERIFVSSVRIAVSLGVTTRPLIIKEIRRVYNPRKHRSDFPLTRFAAEILIGGQAIPDAVKRGFP